LIAGKVSTEKPVLLIDGEVILLVVISGVKDRDVDLLGDAIG
jgi:hypothetical protein